MRLRLEQIAYALALRAQWCLLALHRRLDLDELSIARRLTEDRARLARLVFENGPPFEDASLCAKCAAASVCIAPVNPEFSQKRSSLFDRNEYFTENKRS